MNFVLSTILVAALAGSDCCKNPVASKLEWVAAVQSCEGVYGALVNLTARPEAMAITRVELARLLARCESEAPMQAGGRQIRLNSEESILASSSAGVGAVQKDTL